jgi:TRAP transporter TAXI family solute receptor
MSIRTVLLVILGLAVLWGGGCSTRSSDVRIATGQRGGTFLPLGETLAAGFASDIDGARFSALESPGGVASIAMLDAGEAELALLSNHVRGASSLQLVAPLYEETLHVVVRRAAGIETAHGLAGHAVSVGPAGSGTESIADAVLQHFGVATESFERHNMALPDAVAALGAGEIDAAFIVGGMRTPAVDGLLQRSDMVLLSLGEPGRPGSALEGIRLDAPFFSVTAIPEHAYGVQPEHPIGTISVHALLVARADLDEDLVFAITESLFSRKVELSMQERLLSHLSERYDETLSPYPLHPGADRYFRRDEPTIVQRYSDQIGLAITVGALLWSGITGFHSARRQARRNRIETHYETARQSARAAADARTDAEVESARRGLVAARERALMELEAERLDANDAFMVLQRFLDTAIAELDREAHGRSRRAARAHEDVASTASLTTGAAPSRRGSAAPGAA